MSSWALRSLARTIAHHQSEIAAEILDAWTGEDGFRQTALAAGGGRHFYGHGAFSPDGAFLYTSENRFEDGAGIIGVWEAARD